MSRWDVVTIAGGAEETEGEITLSTEAGKIRRVLERSRSIVFARLFDYLLERSADNRAPKEIEIAFAVFGKEATFDTSQDSTVRVYVSRLRKKLDEFYAGWQGPRLHIQKGDYRIVLLDAAAESEAEDSSAWLQILQGRRKLWAALALILGLIAAVWATWLPRRDDRAPLAVATTSFWRPLVSSERPSVIVAGDHYMFAETENVKDISRLILAPTINSTDDLDLYLIRHPGEFLRFHDLGLHYVPAAATKALRTVLPLMLTLRKGRTPDLISSSELTAETLKSSDVVYIGYLSALRILRNPLFQASRFKVGPTYSELIDTVTGKRYVADGGRIVQEQVARRDYGYIASLPGPVGNRILIIAGLRDPALLQMADLVANKRQLDLISKRAGGGEAFEALYQVRTMGNLNLGSTLLVARPLRSAGVWDRPLPSQRFPDQFFHDNPIDAHN